MEIAIAREIRSLALLIIRRRFLGCYNDTAFRVDIIALAQMLSRITTVKTHTYYFAWMRYYHWIERNRTAILNGGIDNGETL